MSTATDVAVGAGPDSRAEPELSRTMVDHAYQGVGVQMVLRLVLIVFVVLTSALIPPDRGDVATYAIVAAYAAWLVVLGWQLRPGGRWNVRTLWPAVFVDVAALSALALVAGTTSADESWTSEVLLRGFFIIPVIAVLEQRWRLCIAVCLPAIGTYLTVSLITREANGEPVAAVLLRTVVLTGLSVGCVLLARVQASRVAAISELAGARDELLSQLMSIEGHERGSLAENLHDGALQYVLAARLDLEDLEAHTAPEAAGTVERIDQALRETAGLLRSTVTELHPQVLEKSGLRRAVAELARTSATRGRFQVTVDGDRWDDDARTTADPLLFNAARELLTNVVKHARAEHVRVTLLLADGIASLTVADDGVGIPPGRLETQLAAGHIGVASHRVRLSAVGGGMTLRSGDGGGTVAHVWMPTGRVRTSGG
jgi:two-component system NarL family sensor kinase